MSVFTFWTKSFLDNIMQLQRAGVCAHACECARACVCVSARNQSGPTGLVADLASDSHSVPDVYHVIKATSPQ